ncbi:GNAT family N-acetyltransferase [bacterium]|nr:GNAT family N-acetyltransferase [bacterium]
MIRLLTDADLPGAVTLLRREPAFNLYTLGNLETLGLESEISQVWGDFAEDGVLRAVLNRYMTGWVVYGMPEADWAGMGHILDHHPLQADRLQDNPGGVTSFLPYLHRYRLLEVKVETLMELTQADFQPQPAVSGVVVRRATNVDLDALVALYADAGDMSRSVTGVKRPLQSGRIWIAEVDRVLVSAALTNAETADQAMIGGVFTKPDARGQGLSQAVVSALCADLLTAHRKPVLYWANPIAGAVYDKLGFRAIGEWRAVRLQRTNVE